MIMVIAPNKRYLEEQAKQQAREARQAAAAVDPEPETAPAAVDTEPASDAS
jgi:hypothetical protein